MRQLIFKATHSYDVQKKVYEVMTEDIFSQYKINFKCNILLSAPYAESKNIGQMFVIETL